jgi:gamma-glutamyltranspeptidase/glutathione hydrolase
MVEKAISTPHALATQAGVEAFKDGGNAIDAALAAAGVLAVVYPHQCSAGGDLFALVDNGSGRTWSVNGSGAAPRELDPAQLRRQSSEMPDSGPDSITVPGVVAGWATVQGLGAALPLSRLLRPALRAAAEGVPITALLAASIRARAATLLRDPGMRALFFPNGEPLATGALLRQPQLARTLELLADDGPEAFYVGLIGEQLITGLQRLGSRLTRDDFAAHRTEVDAPLRLEHKGFQLQTCPPNSQGFCLLEAIAALDALGVDIDPRGVDSRLLLRALLLAAGDREKHLGDPRCRPVPVAELLAPERLRKLMNLPLLNRTNVAQAPAHGDTVAICAADSSGFAVCLIQSVFQSFGSGLLECQTGVILHNRGRGFSLAPGAPNELLPNTRPAHTLTPLLIHRDGQLRAVVGTMGGRAQPQILAQLLPAVLDPQMKLSELLDAPRWVAGSRDIGFETATVAIESDAPPALDSILARENIDVARIASRSELVGHAQIVRVGSDGALQAACDPRSDGAAAVVAC